MRSLFVVKGSTWEKRTKYTYYPFMFIHELDGRINGFLLEPLIISGCPLGPLVAGDDQKVADTADE